MKACVLRRCMAMLLAGLALWATPVHAACDFECYEVEGAYGTQVVVLSDGVLALHIAKLNLGYFPTSVVRWTNGVCTLRAQLEEHDTRVGRRIAAFTNGRCGLVEACDGVVTWREITRDTLGEAKTLGVGLDEVEAHGCGLTAIQHAENGDVLWLFDGELRCRVKLPLAYENASVFSLRADGDGYVLLCGGRVGSEVTAMRLNASGEPVWQLTLDGRKAYFNQICPDGQGGALVEGALSDDYKRAHVIHIDASGAIDARKTLRAKNAILSAAHTAVNADGTVTIYGSAVARSSGLYDAFAMTVDWTLKVLALDVREFSVREDYGFSYRVAPDGRAYVYSSAEGFGSIQRHNALLVPFDVLPAAKDPGISLR